MYIFHKLREKVHGSGWEWTQTLQARAGVEHAGCGSGQSWSEIQREWAGAGLRKQSRTGLYKKAVHDPLKKIVLFCIMSTGFIMFEYIFLMHTTFKISIRLLNAPLIFIFIYPSISKIFAVQLNITMQKIL